MWIIFLLPLLSLICYSRELISNALKRLKLLCIGQNFRHLSLMSGENFKPKMSFAVRFVLKPLFLNKNYYKIFYRGLNFFTVTSKTFLRFYPTYTMQVCRGKSRSISRDKVHALVVNCVRALDAFRHHFDVWKLSFVFF